MSSLAQQRLSELASAARAAAGYRHLPRFRSIRLLLGPGSKPGSKEPGDPIARARRAAQAEDARGEDEGSRASQLELAAESLAQRRMVKMTELRDCLGLSLANPLQIIGPLRTVVAIAALSPLLLPPPTRRS